MLQALQVRDFGLIEHLELVFSAGLNLISGETGAGKSMLIDAMLLVCGGRASADLIRTGSEHASVDAVFALPHGSQAAALLRDAGFDSGDGQVVVSREINLSGRNISRINGRPAPVAVVRELASHLVDIHGQHEHQSLLHPAKHRELLDSYGGSPHLALVDKVRALFGRLRELRGQLADVAGNARDRAQRQDLLRFQLMEIESARLQAGEDEQLRTERGLLINAERLAAAADAAYAALYESAASDAGGYGQAVRGGRSGGGGGAAVGGPSARDAMGVALGELESASTIDPRLDPQTETLRTLLYSLDDLSGELRRYRESLEFDPGRLDEIQARLELLANLRRKYADTITGVIAYGEDIRSQLARLADSEETAAQLETEIAKVVEAFGEAAAALSLARGELAAALETQVASELAGLGMPKAEFRVQLEQRPLSDGIVVNGQAVAYGSWGADEVEFMLSPNPGEPPRRLARAASGGELSRIMLALKTVLARADQIPAMIFDEVDSGVGGRTANAVGLRLAALGHSHQVLCVTHLPQIAAYADHHYVVVKESSEQSTRTIVREVCDDERLDELARMLGADSGAPAALEHARELLRRSARATSDLSDLIERSQSN
jgi:DNA repair protein RecN (Recombination protein N)